MSGPEPVTAEAIRDAFSVKGRVALITGASQNTGATIARVFGVAGAKVAAAATRVSAELQGVVDDINGAGGTGIAVGMDLAGESFDEPIAGIEVQLGPVDILINNAVTRQGMADGEITAQEWDRVHAVNLRAPFLLAQALLPGMVERGFGRVINVSGTNATDYMPSSIIPSVSKAGLLGVTRVLGSRYASYGPDPDEWKWPTMDVTVNSLQAARIAITSPVRVPDSVPKSLTDFQRGRSELYNKRLPAGRGGQMVEYALSAMFLASPAAGYITGSTLYVSGGLVI